MPSEGTAPGLVAVARSARAEYGHPVKPGRLLTVLAAATSLAACSVSSAVAPTGEELQGVLTPHNVTFTAIGGGDLASSRGDVVDRASRGSGLPARLATWIYSGELTAQGAQGQTLVERSVWAVYFTGFEQPMLGPRGGIAVSDWVVFVEMGTGTVVLSVSVATST